VLGQGKHRGDDFGLPGFEAVAVYLQKEGTGYEDESRPVPSTSQLAHGGGITLHELARRSHLTGNFLPICRGTVQVFRQQFFHFALEIDPFGGEAGLQALVKFAFETYAHHFLFRGGHFWSVSLYLILALGMNHIKKD
jgi:hypothetical protein